MSRFEQPTQEPFVRRPLISWIILMSLLVLVLGFVAATVIRDQTGRAALAEQSNSYAAQAEAIDQARQRSVDQEQARRSASME